MKSIYALLILGLLPMLSHSQSISLDELIQIQKTPKNALNYIASIIIPNKLTQIESLEETPEDLGRKVWRLSNDAKVTLFYGADVDNRVIFQSEDEQDYNEIRSQMDKYGMKLIDNELDYPFIISTHIGVNHAIIKTFSVSKDSPPYTFELYKKKDYFLNKDQILASWKHQIVEKFLGGIVFSVSETGRHGYIMTPFDVANDADLYTACMAYFSLTNNKQNIDYYHPPSEYSKWEIPTLMRMNTIYLNLSKTGLVNFEDKFFWTQDYDVKMDLAKIINLKTGETRQVSISNKNNKCSLILIRHF
jgi:hypothetical protein